MSLYSSAYPAIERSRSRGFQKSVGSQMPKILHVITSLRCGGAEGVLARLVLATRSEFEHIVVALRDDGQLAPLLRSAGIVVRELGIDSRRGAVLGVASLTGLIRKEQPVIVQTWLYHADLIGGIAARLAGIRSIVWGVRNTNLSAAAISRSTRCVAWLAARLSGVIPQVIVCNSIASSREHIAFGYQAAPFRVIANGFDLERLHPDSVVRAATRASLGIPPGALLVGNVARWDPQKDHDNLLAALRSVALNQPALRVVLIGAGMEWGNARLAELVRMSGLQERVALLGQRDDVPALMNALDLHVLSSLGEAFPNVVPEAMSCGTPCVVTDVGDAARIVGDTGWVVPARDPAALAAAIERALAALQQHGREALGKRCRERIVAHYDLRSMTDAYTALWGELAAGATRSNAHATS
jgi:glycosyltransferase involved in cell wall biosynthesis